MLEQRSTSAECKRVLSEQLKAPRETRVSLRSGMMKFPSIEEVVRVGRLGAKTFQSELRSVICPDRRLVPATSSNLEPVTLDIARYCL